MFNFHNINEQRAEHIQKSFKSDVIEKAMTTESTPAKEKLTGKNKDAKVDDFQHHRLMAGFHAMKQKEHSKKGMDLHSSSNPDVNKDAKGSDGEAKRHQNLMEAHLEKAKSLHNKEKHGEWNKTIPTSKDALEYGNTYAEKVDKGIDSKEAVKDSKIKKSFDDGIDILKGGVGSGRKLGHTRNGYPIYANEQPNHISNWSAGDHEDASVAHEKEASKHELERRETKKDSEADKLGHKNVEKHYNYAADHARLADRIRERTPDLIKKSELETLSKSDLTWQLNQEQFNASKKGSELISLANGKLARLNEQKTNLLTQLGLQREGIIKLKSDFTFPENYTGIDYDSFKRDELGDSYDSMYKLRNDYNSLCYAIKDIQNDITFLTTFINNLDPNKNYKLSVQQINTLEKAEEQDLYKGENRKDDEDEFEQEIAKAVTPEKKAKMKKVMDEFKAGELKSSSGETVTDRAQAIAIGLSESGQSKIKKSQQDIDEAIKILSL